MNIDNYIHNKFKNNKELYDLINNHYLFDCVNNKAIINLNIKNAKCFNIKTPEWQRETYNDKINDIIKFQIKTYEKTKNFMFINNIVIDYCIKDNSFYLIDGQHRYKAAIELANKHNYQINIWFEFILSNNLSEVKEHFDLINKHTLQPEKISDITKKLFDYYQNKYKKIFKSDVKTTKKPYILSNVFISAISYLIDELNKKHNKQHTFDEIITIINNKNIICSKYTLNDWKQIKDLKNLESIIDIADKNKFYLGIYTQSKKEYTYKWIQEILEYHEEKQKIPPIKKQKIPPIKKQEIWEYWKGNVSKSNCHCCRKITIYSNSYHCGHVIAESNGGTLDIENLRPICQSCNSSMNNKNMIDYMNIHYKENVSHFYSKY